MGSSNVLGFLTSLANRLASDQAQSVIISIDGKTSATLDSDALHDILIGPVGSTLHLTVRSGTTTRDVPVILRDVL